MRLFLPILLLLPLSWLMSSISRLTKCLSVLMLRNFIKSWTLLVLLLLRFVLLLFLVSRICFLSLRNFLVILGLICCFWPPLLWRPKMTNTEMHKRLARLYEKLHFCCLGLFDSMDRYGKTFDWLDKCRSYNRAIEYLWKRLG